LNTVLCTIFDFYDRILRDGILAVGESYTEGWWDSDQLDEMIARALRADVDQYFRTWKIALGALRARVFNPQTYGKSFKNAGHHYDIGDDLYKRMLDSRMIYSCAYWKEAGNLEEAQEHKLDLICKKLVLKPGMRVLDIGCGWGSLAKYMAERYDLRVLGITVSQNQYEFAKKNCEGLPVEIECRDYRDLSGQFDRIVSVGMFEHVGPKNYSQFMKVSHACLKDEGLFLLHTIGGNKSRSRINPWIHKYIFPNAVLPSPKQITKATEGLFILEDWHSFGPDYDKTLMAWFDNFKAHWEELRPQYGDKFFRLWKFYLLSCAGTFRARENQLWQILLSKHGFPIEHYR